MSQTRLTKEQTDRFFKEYERIKSKNYFGSIMDKSVWKNQIEEILNEDATGRNWSNTEIRRATHQLARQDSWSRKQEKALIHNIVYGESDYLKDTREALKQEFGDVNLETFIKRNLGAVSRFLASYSWNWNEYFNS
jgi:dsDNA-specific endonuclease/ATPase MutS2